MRQRAFESSLSVPGQYLLFPSEPCHDSQKNQIDFKYSVLRVSDDITLAGKMISSSPSKGKKSRKDQLVGATVLTIRKNIDDKRLLQHSLIGQPFGNS